MGAVPNILDDRARDGAADEVVDQVRNLTNDELFLAIVWCERRTEQAEDITQRIHQQLPPMWRNRVRYCRGRTHIVPRWAGLRSRAPSPWQATGMDWVTSGAVAAAYAFPDVASDDVAQVRTWYQEAMQLVEASRRSTAMREVILGLVTAWSGTADDLVATAEQVT